MFFNNKGVYGEDLVPVKCISPSGLGCRPSQGGGSVVVDSLLIVDPFVGFCVCSMSYCAFLCVLTSFAIILMTKRELVALLCLSSWFLVIVIVL